MTLVEALQPDSPYVFYSDDHGFCINTADVMDILTMDKESVIYRQDAIDEIKEIYEWHDNVTKERIIEHFERLPFAQPVRKRGKWLVDEDGNMECPFCGNTCGFGNYCNECGADLRGEQDE